MKKSIQSVLAAVVLLVISSGCAFATTPVPPTLTLIPPTLTPIPPTFTPIPTATATPIIYNAIVNVIDENGNSLSNAKIIQGETVELTDNQGSWHKSGQSPELSISVWAQGYLLQEYSSSMQAGDNDIQIQLLLDPFGLKTSDLEKEGYELVFVEDFQDGSVDCTIKGNGNVEKDDTDSANQLLLVDLRNLDDDFSCFFGPTNLQDAIIEVDFRYPEIRYSEFKENEYVHYQGYYVEFRDNFNVVGFPLHSLWGGPQLQVIDFTTDERKVRLSAKQEIQEKRWYQLNTKYDGTKVEVRLNDSLRFTFLNPPSMINSDQSHFGAFSQAYIQFDNIKMWTPKK